MTLEDVKAILGELVLPSRRQYDFPAIIMSEGEGGVSGFEASWMIAENACFQVMLDHESHVKHRVLLFWQRSWIEGQALKLAIQIGIINGPYYGP